MSDDTRTERLKTIDRLLMLYVIKTMSEKGEKCPKCGGEMVKGINLPPLPMPFITKWVCVDCNYTRRDY